MTCFYNETWQSKSLVNKGSTGCSPGLTGLFEKHSSTEKKNKLKNKEIILFQWPCASGNNLSKLATPSNIRSFSVNKLGNELARLKENIGFKRVKIIMEWIQCFIKYSLN